MDMKLVLRKAKKTQKEISIIELKRLTSGFRCDIIQIIKRPFYEVNKR